MEKRLTLRSATAADAETLAALYAPHVLHGSATFEEEPPSAAEMARRLDDVLAAGLPWLIAEADGRALGYAYAGPYRARSAYRFTAEDSIYLSADAQGRGVGRALLSAVIDGVAVAGRRTLVAAIGDAQNVASIALHARLGFHHVGTLEAVGFKHGRWLDVVIMQRQLAPHTIR